MEIYDPPEIWTRTYLNPIQEFVQSFVKGIKVWWILSSCTEKYLWAIKTHIHQTDLNQKWYHTYDH